MIVATAGIVFASCRSSPPPNIVLYVVDTLRFDALHCDGNGNVQTPAMDRLALDGMRFTRAYANASWTRPSMGTLLTGTYPTVHGAVGRNDALRRGVHTLAGSLRSAGYRTAAVYANANIGPEFGFGEGFDDFIALRPARFVNDPTVPRNEVGTADNVVNRAIEWLRGRDRRPFFLLVFTVDPHAPYEPPAP
ncbi:MAG TPA: sulfatase-like hydrolase/transferase, partial [Candidatus Acidoferrales bacterium]|nr:sulfatase-like hydrolase/transferase [Candidatus Acidoferrales bacterium]